MGIASTCGWGCRGADRTHMKFDAGKPIYLAAIVAALALSCTPMYRNAPLTHFDTGAGYRLDVLDRGKDNTDSVFVCLTFSGGGTRSAAFAYGVLKALGDTPKDRAATGGGPSLLDEVDLISGVSGGAFTAVAYGLWRDGVFDGTYERRFLRRNVQWELLVNLLRPISLLRTPFVLMDRIDVAAYYYDERVFDKATYGDLLADGRRPFIVVNATDMTRRQRFEFTQDDFDLLGSDLSALPLGWAAAASSAVPLLLSPLRFRYFPGDALRGAVRQTVNVPECVGVPRRQRWAKSLLPDDGVEQESPFRIDSDAHKFLYLLDGGLADNLGLTHVLESVRHGAIKGLIEQGKINKLVVIVVDASIEPSSDLERRPSSPGLLAVGKRSSSIGLYNQSATLTELVRYALHEAFRSTKTAYKECEAAIDKACPNAVAPTLPTQYDLDTYIIDVNFRRVPDRKKREDLLRVMTTFFLPKEDIDSLIRAGHDVLIHHPEFQRLRDDLAVPTQSLP